MGLQGCILEKHLQPCRKWAGKGEQCWALPSVQDRGLLSSWGTMGGSVENTGKTCIMSTTTHPDHMETRTVLFLVLHSLGPCASYYPPGSGRRASTQRCSCTPQLLAVSQQPRREDLPAASSNPGWSVCSCLIQAGL